MLYCTILYYTTLYYTIPYCTVLADGPEGAEAPRPGRPPAAEAPGGQQVPGLSLVYMLLRVRALFMCYMTACAIASVVLVPGLEAPVGGERREPAPRRQMQGDHLLDNARLTLLV